MHSVIIEWGGDKFFSGVTMGAAEEEFAAESEMGGRRGEATEAEGENSRVWPQLRAENPTLGSQELVWKNNNNTPLWDVTFCDDLRFQGEIWKKSNFTLNYLTQCRSVEWKARGGEGDREECACVCVREWLADGGGEDAGGGDFQELPNVPLANWSETHTSPPPS